jgi:hypothetical protein
MAILSGTDPDFPLYLEQITIPQAETTINLVQQSQIHPQLSVYAYERVHPIVTYYSHVSVTFWVETIFDYV